MWPFRKAPEPSNALTLPRHDPNVVEWEPPLPIEVPAVAQAQALIGLFQAEGRTGLVPHHELMASYPELAWSRGFVQVSERAMLKALGSVCRRVRPYPHRVHSYIIPGPNDKRTRQAKPNKVVRLNGRMKPGIQSDAAAPWPDLPQRAIGG